MLGMFPDPYRDELLLSICSRYHERLGYRSRESTGWDLFAHSQARVAADLPSNINQLVSLLPPHHPYTADGLIHENTLYPIYRPFLSSQRALYLREDMKKKRGGAVHGRAGVLTSKINPTYLRFCPECVIEDRNRWGETYWHRLHQVPGVEVCPAHHVFLENSSRPARSRSNGDVYLVAEKAVHTMTPRSLKQSSRSHPTLLKIALDAKWLLDNPHLAPEPEVTRNRYIRLLFEKRLATYTGVVHFTQLRDAFLKFYSPHLLRRLRCSLRLRNHWLKRVLQACCRAAQPMVLHSLLMNFLGCSAEEFFSLPATPIKPFGEAPWPCLNPASDHYGQPRVMRCEITQFRDRNVERKILLGTFQCSCGFVYSRKGPDLSPEDRQRIFKIKEYGHVWERALRSMFESKNLTVEEIALRLDMSESVIGDYLMDLYTIPLPVDSAKRSDKKRESREINPSPEDLETYRNDFLRTLSQYPDAGRSKLREKDRRTYYWLHKYDKEWFQANCPPRLRSHGPPPLTNWKERDLILTEEAKKAATKRFSAPGRPEQVSKTAIAKDIGVLEIALKRAHLIPLTVKAIEQLAESAEALTIRRIWWAVNSFREENITPKAYQIQQRACFSSEMFDKPEVRDGFDEAVRSVGGWQLTEVQKVS